MVQREEPRRSTSVAVWLLLSLILLAGAALRLVNFRESLWLDELHSAWTVSGSLGEVAERATMGNQPPPPYWGLWIYTRVAGVNETSVRLPSLVASVAAIVTLFCVVRRWTASDAAAVVAATALAFDDHSIFYGNEARVYALVQFGAILHVAAFAEVLRGGQRWARIACVVIGWTLFYAHYTTALLFVAEFTAWLMAALVWKRNTYTVRAVAVDAAIFALGCLPALPHLAGVAGPRGYWEYFVERPLVVDLWFELPHRIVLAIAVVGAGVLLLLRKQGASATDSTDESGSDRNDRSALSTVAFAWLLVPLVTAWLLAYSDIARVFFYRYLVHLVGASGAILGLLVAAVPRGKFRGAIAATLMLLLIVISAGEHRRDFGTFLPLGRNEDWRGAIAELNRRDWQPGESLLFASGLIEAEALRTTPEDAALHEYCLYPLHSVYPLTASVAEVPLPYERPGDLSPAVRGKVADWLIAHESFVALVRGDAGAFDRQLTASLNGSVRLERRQSFGHLSILHFTRGE